MHASYLLDVCLTFARRLLDACLMFAWSCKLGVFYINAAVFYVVSMFHKSSAKRTEWRNYLSCVRSKYLLSRDWYARQRRRL